MKSHRRKRAPLPLLNAQAPAHLDNVGFLVFRVRFLHGLGSDGKDVFEEAPVRSTPQKILTHRDERSKVCDGIGSKVMEFGTEKF